MKQLCLSLYVISSLTSCQISGLTSGYNHLTRAEKEKVIKLEGDIDAILDFSKVYTISIKQVKQYIATHEKVLLYDYTPYCHSANCVSPTALVSQCKDKGIDVLVISNIYDDIFKQRHTAFPMLMIDTKSFSTKWRWKYTDLFYVPLIGHTAKELNYAGFHYFENGTYVKSFKNPNEI